MTAPSSKSGSFEGLGKEQGEAAAVGKSEYGTEHPTTKTEEVLDQVNVVADRSEGEDQHEYPKAWKLAVIIIALCLAVFCMALDNTMYVPFVPLSHPPSLPRAAISFVELTT